MLDSQFNDMELLAVEQRVHRQEALGHELGRGPRQGRHCRDTLTGKVIVDVLKCSVQSQGSTGLKTWWFLCCWIHQWEQRPRRERGDGALPGHGAGSAQNVESSGMTLMEAERGQDLHVSVTMPSVEVGTVGGGTDSAQRACLEMLGIAGANPDSGANAQELARVTAAAVSRKTSPECLASNHLVTLT